MNNWRFLATEIDDHSLRCAYDNVTRNGLQDKISGRDSHLTSCSTTVQPHATMHNHCATMLNHCVTTCNHAQPLCNHLGGCVQLVGDYMYSTFSYLIVVHVI